MQSKKNAVIAVLAVLALVFGVLFFVTNSDKAKLADTKTGLENQVNSLNEEKETLERQVAVLKDEAVLAAESAKADLDKAVQDAAAAAQAQIDAAVKAKEEAEAALQAVREEAPAAAGELDFAAVFPSWNPDSAALREIGKRPVLAFGNSSGDYSMLNYAEGNPDHPGMGIFVVCDDTVREYGSETKAADFYAEAEKQGWTAFSMANDWLTIYGDGVEKVGLPGAEEEALPDAA